MSRPSARPDERRPPATPALAVAPGRERNADLRDLAVRARSAGHWDLDGPAQAVDQAIRGESGREPDDAARRAKLGLLSLLLPGRVADLDLPASVRGRYPEALSRLARTVAETGHYPPEDFAKDVRLAVGASVPAGAQSVDLNDHATSGVVARRLVRHSALALRLAATGELAQAAHLASVAQGRPWLQHHTDARYLDEFDEPGWRRFHLTAADLLETRPDAAGIFGASWFYDPQVAAISPKLAYLQRAPLSHGALQVPLPTDPRQVAYALHRSPTRQRLYEEGLYRPTCHAILWPRRELLGWAARERAAG